MTAAASSGASQADGVRTTAQEIVAALSLPLSLPSAEPLRPLPMGRTIGRDSAGQARWASDSLISIGDIRKFFKLGRTAAYELTHRPEFPEPVPISSRCYRWWASEVEEFAVALRKGAEQRVPGGTRQAKKSRASHPSTTPRRITGKVRPVRTRRETS
jgi:predicted DNA-binding transcriptional regulator AlpA